MATLFVFNLCLLLCMGCFYGNTFLALTIINLLFIILSVSMATHFWFLPIHTANEPRLHSTHTKHTTDTASYCN